MAHGHPQVSVRHWVVVRGGVIIGVGSGVNTQWIFAQGVIVLYPCLDCMVVISTTRLHQSLPTYLSIPSLMFTNLPAFVYASVSRRLLLRIYLLITDLAAPVSTWTCVLYIFICLPVLLDVDCFHVKCDSNGSIFTLAVYLVRSPTLLNSSKGEKTWINTLSPHLPPPPHLPFPTVT